MGDNFPPLVPIPAKSLPVWPATNLPNTPDIPDIPGKLKCSQCQEPCNTLFECFHCSGKISYCCGGSFENTEIGECHSCHYQSN